LGQDFNTVHESANTVSNFSLKSSCIFEVINLTFHLNKVTNKTTKRSWWKDFTKQANESKLSNKLHIISDDISFFTIQGIVLEALIPSNTERITRFALNL
jgi:hypothetical protein